PIEFHLERIVTGAETLKEKVGFGRPPELSKCRLPGIAEANHSRGINVTSARLRNTMIRHIGDIEREVARQRLLDGQIPRFHIRLPEMLIHNKIQLVNIGVGNDSVIGNRDECGRRKTLCQSYVCAAW